MVEKPSNLRAAELSLDAVQQSMVTSLPKNRICVIGDPIAHSRSPLIHNYWIAASELSGSYEAKRVAGEELETFIRSMGDGGFTGCNVTVPHKQAVMPFLDRLNDTAAKIGAVNTVWIEDGRLIGGNSDAHGFIAHLDATLPDWQSSVRKALVLGAGGAARAAVFALTERGLDVTIVNRTFETARRLAADFNARATASPWNEINAFLPVTDLLVNTTSLGMQGKRPLEIDLSSLPRNAIVYDAVYVPLETDLLKQARARGLRSVDGLGMLLHQAGFGFKKWFGIAPAIDQALRALLEADLER